MNPSRHDFRKPARLAGNLEERLATWLRVACQFASKRAPNHLPYAFQFALGEVKVSTPDDALDTLPEGLVGFNVAIGEKGVVSLLACSRQLALTLVAGALGETTGTLPPDRDLTIVEESLCQYLLQQLFALALQETYPGRATLPVTIQHREQQPNWIRMFGSAECLLHCSLLLTGPMGAQTIYWLVPPRGPVEQLTRQGRAADSPPETAETLQIDAIVRELPVEVAVVLGTIELSFSELSSLKPGDLLILGQRITDPLLGLVDGLQKFKAWPGRAGSRLAIQVESLTG